MGFIGLLRTLEQITRPPRLGHDLDLEDGAEQLSEREAAEEVSEPRPPGFYTTMDPEWADLHYGFPYPPTDKERHVASDGGEWVFNNLNTGDWDAVSYPGSHPRLCLCRTCAPHLHADIEPPLTPDELVGVRELLERFGLADVPAAPSPAGTGSPADDGHSPAPPAGERPDGDCFDYCVGHPEDAVAEWIGEAVPVISELLTKHFFYLANHSSIGSEDHCLCGHRPRGALAWNAHVAPIIANALAPQDK